MRGNKIFAAGLVAMLAAGCVQQLTSPDTTGVPDVCSLASDSEVRAILDAERVDVPADQLGEATVPYCLWATNGRITEMTLEIWSPEDLEAVLRTDPQSYYEKRWHDAGSVREDWVGVGDAAYYAAYEGDDPEKSVVEIVVRRGRLTLVFNATRITTVKALAFAKAVSGRV